MIIKLHQQLPWKRFKSTRQIVGAVRMKEDFMFESRLGWQQGFKGQWLLECGEGMRCAIDDQAFSRQYKPTGDHKT